MQQQPPKGRLFPDRPVEQTSAPRFSNNNTQGYEAQPRMQQTGSYGMSQSSRFGTGSFQAVRDSQPVNTMPPMSAMPTAQNYAAQQVSGSSKRFATGSFQPVRDSQPVNTMPPVTTVANPQPVVQQGAPVMMQTVQGTPVLISQEQLQAVVTQLTAQGLIKPAEEKKESARSKTDRKGDQKERKEKKTKVIARPSLFWLIFGLIGIGTVLYLLYGQVIVPLRVILYDLANGGA